MNVGMPVFTIHGNHDDPAGEENLSAVSILSSAGLVNYFGKQVSLHGATDRLARPVYARCGSPSCCTAAPLRPLQSGNACQSCTARVRSHWLVNIVTTCS